MLEIGLLVLIIGAIIKIWIKLSHYQEVREMAPQPVSCRSASIKFLRASQRLASMESSVMLSIGIILVLSYGVFN